MPHAGPSFNAPTEDLCDDPPQAGDLNDLDARLRDVRAQKPRVSGWPARNGSRFTRSRLGLYVTMLPMRRHYGIPVAEGMAAGRETDVPCHL